MLIKFDIKKEEIQALDNLFNKSKILVHNGLILGLFRIKLQEAIRNAEKKAQKKMIEDEAKRLLGEK